MQHLSGLLDYETMALHADPASPTAPSLTRTKPRHLSGWSPARGRRVSLMNWPLVT